MGIKNRYKAILPLLIMTEIINKYNNGKIYTIRSYKTDLYYIGSTTQPLYKRLYEHRKAILSRNDGKRGYTSSEEILKFDDHYIELLEEFKCENKMQLEKREGELIREHKNNCVNKNIMGRTEKEWREDNKDILKDKRKHYYEDNKDIIREKHKQYNEDNKEHLSEWSKQWRNDNKDILTEKNKQYREDNKDKLMEKKQCICGGNYLYKHKSTHEKTQKHIRYFLIYNNV